MAKKSRKQVKNKSDKKLIDSLPQNILQIGDRVEEDKAIYIYQPVFKEIHKFTKNKTTNESGGILVGRTIEEFGKTNIIIEGFVEARYSTATPTTLTFTHETWDYVHKEVEKKYQHSKIVGWIHTHPDFGVFLSEYDKFIHQNFFGEDYQVAYVVDPIQKIEGFYFWIDQALKKCNGFYIYDKTGNTISVDIEKNDKDMPSDEDRFVSRTKNVLLVILSILVVLLAFSHVSMNNRLNDVEKAQEEIKEQQDIIINNVGYDLYQMQQIVNAYGQSVQDIVEILKEKGIVDSEGESDNIDSDDSTDKQNGIEPNASNIKK